MSKRNLIDEILERRARKMDSEPFGVAISRIQTLMNAYSDQFKLLLKPPVTNELFEHVAVICVAVLQNYVSDTIAILINLENDDTYRNNARNLKNISFGIEAVLAIGGKTITAGEFISHNLKFNSIADIDRVLSEILAFRLFKTIKKLEKGNSRIDFGKLEEMYKHRHIICHEYGMTVEMTNHDAFDYLYNTIALLMGLEKVILEDKMDTLLPHRSEKFEDFKVR